MKASGFLSGGDQVGSYLPIVALDFRPRRGVMRIRFVVGLNIRKKQLYAKGYRPGNIDQKRSG